MFISNNKRNMMYKALKYNTVYTKWVIIVNPMIVARFKVVWVI